MFLGILIAFAIFGLIMIFSNAKNANIYNGAVIMVAIGIFFFLVGTLGSVGWCIEVFLK